MAGRWTGRTVQGKTWIERLRTRAGSLWSGDSPGQSGGPASAPGDENVRVSRLAPLEAPILAERMRADRFGAQFCAVTFRAKGPAEESQAAELLLLALESRVRATDVIGRVAPDGLGVVLPHTTPDGAIVFARSIVAELEVSGLDVSYKIYPYPPQPTDGLAREDQPDPRRATDHPGGADRGRVVHLNGLAATGQGPASIDDLLPAFKAPRWKRALDILGAVVGMICFAPLFIVLAGYIKLVSRGPVLLLQERIGLHGRPFGMWKLRTMHVDADSRVHMKHVLAMIQDKGDGGRPMQKLDAADPRIIPGGCWLRRLSIDEVPQLLNVLLGEMSLVGPRPEMPYAYAAYRSWHARRFNVLPGMTGLWQVSGKNRTTFQEMIRLDINYGQALQPRRDMAILARTLPVVLGAANGEPASATAAPAAARRRLGEVIRRVLQPRVVPALGGNGRLPMLEQGLER